MPETPVAALWAGVIDHPQDLDRRRVLADALEEEGREAAARLLRVGLELAELEEVGPERWCAANPGRTWSDYRRRLEALRGADQDLSGERRHQAQDITTALGFVPALAGPDDRFPAWSGTPLTPDGGAALTWRRGRPECLRCPRGWFREYGRRLVRLAPLTAVTLTDARPQPGAPGSDVWCWWRCSGHWHTCSGCHPRGRAPAHHIPADWFDRLGGGRPAPNRDAALRHLYDDRPAALLDLSQAVLAWARAPDPDPGGCSTARRRTGRGSGRR